MIDLLKTLKYMKPDIKVAVWDDNPLNALGRSADVEINEQYIVFNEIESFRPTAEEILAVDSEEVKAYWDKIDVEVKQATLDDIKRKILELQDQLVNLQNM